MRFQERETNILHFTEFSPKHTQPIRRQRKGSPYLQPSDCRGRTFCQRPLENSPSSPAAEGAQPGGWRPATGVCSSVRSRRTLRPWSWSQMSDVNNVRPPVQLYWTATIVWDVAGEEGPRRDRSASPVAGLLKFFLKMVKRAFWISCASAERL